jgi:hypothetical protein
MVLSTRFDAVIIEPPFDSLRGPPAKEGRSCLASTLVRRAEGYAFIGNGRRWRGNPRKITPLHSLYACSGYACSGSRGFGGGCRSKRTRRGKIQANRFPPQVPAVLIAVWQLALGVHRAGQRADQVTDQNHADHCNRNYIHVAPHPGSAPWPYEPRPLEIPSG